jgi:hypothetical protein
MARVFDDPDSVLSLFRQRAPYKTIWALYGLGNTIGVEETSPWFREDLWDDLFFRNPVFIEAAREAFSAEIVQPSRCHINLNGPMSEGGPHVDMPTFRGVARPHAPTWLLYNMGDSGLFNAWMVPIASALAWFYRGAGGELEYWPNGPSQRSVVETPPLWNVGLMSNNEDTWHRVRAIGPADLQQRLQGAVRESAALHAAKGDAWEIRDGKRLVQHLGPDELRISILWKAQVFKDEEHRKSFEDSALDLDLDQVTDIYLEDLHTRGIQAARPADPRNDPEWRRILQETYPSPFGGQSDYQ